MTDSHVLLYDIKETLALGHIDVQFWSEPFSQMPKMGLGSKWSISEVLLHIVLTH